MQNRDNNYTNSVNTNNTDYNLSIDPVTTHYNTDHFIKISDIQKPSSHDVYRERKNDSAGI